MVITQIASGLITVAEPRSSLIVGKARIFQQEKEKAKQTAWPFLLAFIISSQGCAIVRANSGESFSAARTILIRSSVINIRFCANVSIISRIVAGVDVTVINQHVPTSACPAIRATIIK